MTLIIRALIILVTIELACGLILQSFRSPTIVTQKFRLNAISKEEKEAQFKLQQEVFDHMKTIIIVFSFFKIFAF